MDVFECIKPVLYGCTILSLSVRSSSLLGPLSFSSNAALDGPCQLKPSNVPLQSASTKDTPSFHGGCSSVSQSWDPCFTSKALLLKKQHPIRMWSCCSRLKWLLHGRICFFYWLQIPSPSTNLTRPHWGPHVNSLHTSSIHTGWSCDLGQDMGGKMGSAHNRHC